MDNPIYQLLKEVESGHMTAEKAMVELAIRFVSNNKELIGAANDANVKIMPSNVEFYKGDEIKRITPPHNNGINRKINTTEGNVYKILNVRRRTTVGLADEVNVLIIADGGIKKWYPYKSIIKNFKKVD